MNFYEIKRKDNEVYGGILLERVCKTKTRKRIRSVLFYAMLSALLFVILSWASSPDSTNNLVLTLSYLTFFFRSFFVIFFSLWFAMYLLELMYLSYYFKDSTVDFEVLKLAHAADPRDITKTFMKSDMGRYSLLRLGIDTKQIEVFLKNRKDFVTEAEYEIIENDDDRVTFSEFAYSLVHFDSDFSKLLKRNGVTPTDFKEALDWVSRIKDRIRNEQRWWTKERLAKIPSIGRNWAFGQIYYVERFGHSIYEDISYLRLGNKHRIYSETVSKIENVLSKDNGANVILTSREADFCMNAISSLGREIILGTTLPNLEDKRIYVLDINLLISTYEDKSQFEIMLQKILYQAAKAGNLILVIPHLSDFVENSKGLKTDVKDYLNEVMSSTKLQVIATSSQRGFHEVLETDLDLMRNFEKIVMEDLDEQASLEMVQDEAQIIEAETDLIFTFQSLKRIIQSANRYFSEGTVADKAIDILDEIASYCISNGIQLIGEEEVSKVVEEKTGVPLGILSKNEKNKLSKIEMQLKQRIIGQDRAVEAISSAMKRARLGVANPKKPLGSFLFIGPTGVGKTETSKALSNVFFGEDDEMIRIDMTEFSDSDAVSRLIGDSDKPGILSSKIREKQYGVLLLDEFEKSHPDVHNLFLQILDEGYFSDGSGERVNARNLIIIMTSNAGSELMYRAMEKNINLQSVKEKIIGYLISEKLFRPEFLNRFDDVVLFNSLTKINLEGIVSIMINKLNERLEEKGLDVVSSEELVNFLVSKGENDRFGAREMSRVIQKDIETKIADALISGQIEKGDTITFVNSGGDLGIEVVTK